ncbi:MAG: hypothetical protein Q4A09_09460 [Capnocytophaga felis]|nr:hypothetical protein [Capnocytophaga felis]
MKDLKIGDLLITKKAILGLAFGSFLTGMLLGAFVYTKSVSFVVFMIPAIIIWAIILPKLKKYIKYV